MRRSVDSRPTLGFLSTWSVYEGTTIDNYTHVLFQGICAAARDRDCNLLLGCGIGLPDSPRASRTVWAAPGPGVDFVPVGPWNTDGLIIIPDDLSDAQFDYVQDLRRTGLPIILTTPEKPGPLVAVDNAGGITEAFNHLVQHGHRQIAFIAGKSGRGGDSAERLAAYREALRVAGIPENPCLIAFGEHRREDGRSAMQQILATGAPFTAVLASNDLSCLGAMDVLRAAGRRIPDDVALIGFDDILDARSQLSPLTTVRHPTFALGYQAVLSLLDLLEGKQTGDTQLRLPTPLVIRQSCGCRPESSTFIPSAFPSRQDSEATQIELAHRMAEAVLREAQHSRREEIAGYCLVLVRAFTSSLCTSDTTPFDLALQKLFDWLERHDEDTQTWQAAISTLRRGLSALQPAINPAGLAWADRLIDRARIELSEQVRRQATEALLRQMELSNRLGLMTSQLLAALDASSSANILAQHLPQLGIEHAVVSLYAPRDDDPWAISKVLLEAGLRQESGTESELPGREFSTREFPPPGLYPSSQAFQLALLPLLVDEHTTGFVAFSATNLEPCAAIVHNLASALRTNHLYLDALEGRRLAEEANRLKSRFLSTVSHELRTPLSLIVGLSNMVLQEQPEETPLSQTTQRDIQQIYASAQHLGRLIGDVLDLASSEAGQLRLLREPLDLTEVLSTVVPIAAEMAHEKGLEWEARLPAQSPRIMGDRTRLRQIVLNLVSNAVKFTPAGRVALEVELDSAQVTLKVSDTGIGIAPGDQVKIFGEFQRSERTIQAGLGGLGLGLAISQRLVEQHGGMIGVRSPGDWGSGSTFFFTLPLLPAAGPTAPSEIQLDAQLGTVVVLTEHAESDKRLVAYLNERGFQARAGRTGPATDWLTPLLKSPPAALILDQETAAHQGWALLERVKREPALAQTRVLAYALDVERDRGEWLELNYSAKPLAPEQLTSELARLDSHTARVVLVVDDDPGILDLHCRLVAQTGCRAVSARNGREALELVERQQPDLILLDLMMPELDGFAVLDALRARETTRDIPVIVLTARVLDETDVERLNHGVAAILSKGLFSATETLNRIEATLARQGALGGPTQRLVRRAMGFMHAHYAEPLTREQIARHIHISPDYLTDCFRQELGVTPMAYLNRYRLRQARELLTNSDLSITQVALAVGFSESAHFTRMFQREVGVTPRAYRRGQRRGNE